MPALLALGCWQLSRREEKHAQLASLVVATNNPPLNVAAFGRDDAAGQNLSFRRFTIACRPGAGRGYERGGERADGRPGVLLILPCLIADARHPALDLVAGWRARPGGDTALAPAGPVTGTLVRDQGRYVLVADAGIAPLDAPARPTLDSIPDNHLQYAVTWFALAATLATVFAVWLRRWRRERRTAR